MINRQSTKVQELTATYLDIRVSAILVSKTLEFSQVIENISVTSISVRYINELTRVR